MAENDNKKRKKMNSDNEEENNVNDTRAIDALYERVSQGGTKKVAYFIWALERKPTREEVRKFLEGQLALLQPTDVATCAGCGSGKHKLMACLNAGPDGMMKGCPWCDTLGHSFDQCPSTNNNTFNQLFLVMSRANMPSFQATQSWVNTVRAVVADGPCDLTNFPWTSDFAKVMAPSTSVLQAKVDSTLSASGVCGGDVLPADPATKDWDSIQQTYASM
ncbi:hypothetical protein NW762_006547 [Fusarium torreyae]|uniref:CCHC-type domain-containing protein n=1 Tax=Fusarium torreyae TaxID=1237075 RepID=A0A9W8RZ80_9HYPO|nr:hypothetical protein NW762_006547 [Fusarium torreyae]